MAALTGALLALTAANTVNSYVGGRRSADSAVAQGNYEGAVADQNAAYADTRAADAVARGTEAANRQRSGVRQLIGTQRATLAASGVDVGSGSAADVQTDAAHLGELDALMLQNNARRESFGYQMEATNLRARGELARTAGQNTADSLRNQARSTLLTGALQSWGIANDAGLFNRGGPAATSRAPSTAGQTRGAKGYTGGMRF